MTRSTEETASCAKCSSVFFADARLHEYGEGKKAVFELAERVEWRLDLLDLIRWFAHHKNVGF
jgi:hypothetical protein